MDKKRVLYRDEPSRLSIARTLDQGREFILITDESRHKARLRRTVETISKVLKSRAVASGKAPRSPGATAVGRELLAAVNAEEYSFRGVQNKVFHPYYEVYQRLCTQYSRAIKNYPDGDLWFGRFVSDLREQCRTPELRRRINNASSCARSNSKAVTDLLQEVRNGCSKVLALRFDGGYRVRTDPKLMPGTLSEEVMRRHREAFLHCLRTGPYSENLLGYIWKTEYGEIRGYHHHFLVLLNGQKVCQDIRIAAGLGLRWREVTGGMGSFHSCNQEKERYARCGIGMLNRRDGKKWGYLEDAAQYLAKSDFYMRQVLERPGKCFSVGGFYDPRASASKEG